MFNKLKSWVDHTSRQSLTALAATFVLVIIGLGFIGYALAHQVSAPTSHDSGQLSTKSKMPQPIFNGPVLDFAQPTYLKIPSIGAQSELATVGKMPDGSIDVPKGAEVDQAAWYKNSPAPGEAGASIIEGHIDTVKSGPSVFFDLGKLQSKDKIYVTRDDGVTALFEVVAVRDYDKTSFPTSDVYTNSGRHDAELRLITCGGAFNADTHEYTQNTVVYAKLVSYKH